MNWRSDSVSVLGLVPLAVSGLAFLILLVAAYRRRLADRDRGVARRDIGSLVGLALQAVGFGIAGYGPIDLSLPAADALAMIEAAAITTLAASAVALFDMSTRTMGRNWALVARTRSDHRLIEDGPFAAVRHPIYVALFAYLAAFVVALGHSAQLPLAFAVYAIGTALRVRSEERLLRLTFGATYDDYARRVARFVPGLF